MSPPFFVQIGGRKLTSQFFKVGKIITTHGIKGEIRVYSYTDFPEERFTSGNQLFIGEAGNPTNFTVEVQYSKPHKNMYILKFQKLDMINDVEKFKGLYLWIPEEQQKELDKDEFYYHQIIDCVVETTEGKELGIVKEILNTGANDVWIVKSNDKKEDILIPYIEQVVKNVNIKDKRIIIEIIEGLID